jgi:hypothetical protein
MGTMKVATDYGDGNAPSYVRIMGLSQRLDRKVKQKMRFTDTMKAQDDALNKITKQAEEDNRRSRFQASALSMVTN